MMNICDIPFFVCMNIQVFKKYIILTNKYIDKYNIDMIHNPIYYGKQEIVEVDTKSELHLTPIIIQLICL